MKWIIALFKSLFWAAPGAKLEEPSVETPAPFERPPIIRRREVDPEVRRRRILRKRLAKTADGIITLLTSLRLGQVSTMPGAAADCEVVLSDLLGCDFHLLDEIAEEICEGHEGFLTASPSEQVAATWPIDIAAIAPDKDSDGCYNIGRIYSIDPKQFRGKLKLVPQRCCRIVYGVIEKDGNCWADEMFVGLIGGKWCNIQPNILSNNGSIQSTRYDTAKLRAEIASSFMIYFAIALTARYSWHVAFGSEDGPRLLLPTDARGALQLFTDREKAPDETRRKALRHWVESHYRDTVASGVAYVREHLRGATRFNWKAMPCELLVSAYDLEKDEFFRTQAAEWRAARKHNQVRVRIRRKASA